MKKKHIIIIVAIMLIAVLIVLGWYLTNLPSKIDIEFNGEEVMFDGTVVESGKIVLSGIRYEAKDRIKFSKITIPNLDVQLPETDGFGVYELDNSYDWIIGSFITTKNNCFERFNIYLSTDSDWCVIWLDEANRLFVGSIHEDFIASEILEKVSRHLK